MKEDRFIKENAATWASLESTLKKLGTKGLKKFEKDELDSFINLYNLTCGHLSYCKTYYGNTDTTNYLNRLVASSHSHIYTTKTSNIKNLKDFLFVGFPELLRQNIRFFIVSASLFLLGCLLSYFYTMLSPDNASAFLPSQFQSSDFSEMGSKTWDGSVASSKILTNNIQVGFTAFALGITLAVGTSVVMIYNGFIVGSLAALSAQHNVTVKFWSLILPHGVLELFAIFVCGMAGLIIGYSIIHPGVYSRKDSLIIRGRTAIRLVCGTIPIFVVAGLIEGFITPAPIPELLKLGFAFVTLVMIVLYVVFPVIRRRMA